MRTAIDRKTKERHLLRAAELCRAHELRQLKLYMMLGLPGETSDDIDELGRFALELAAIRAPPGARHRAVRRQEKHATRRRRL